MNTHTAIIRVRDEALVLFQEALALLKPAGQFFVRALSSLGDAAASLMSTGPMKRLGVSGLASVLVSVFALTFTAELLTDDARVLDIETSTQIAEGERSYTYEDAVGEFAALVGTVIGIQSVNAEADRHRGRLESPIL